MTRGLAEQARAADCLQRPLRSRFRQRLTRSVGLLLRSLASWRGPEKTQTKASSRQGSRRRWAGVVAPGPGSGMAGDVHWPARAPTCPRVVDSASSAAGSAVAGTGHRRVSRDDFLGVSHLLHMAFLTGLYGFMMPTMMRAPRAVTPTPSSLAA